ncbi:MAG TPA: LysR family transcriptional regulator [Alphaproteobacteria bacterium]|nr:LysR family transcriptional regulator [Alphaproteobacteria bacterium]
MAPDWFLRARLKLRHLQLFVALDDQRNLFRAAAQLNMSQPAASKLLGDIEEALGVRLFERLPRGVEPNWYGDIMIRRARIVLAELEQAAGEIAALRAGDSGSVAIGTVMAPAVEIVVDAIEAVRRDHPRLQIAVEVETSVHLVERVRDGRLDFAIGRIPRGVDPAPFSYDEIGEEEMSIICRHDHPLLGREAGPLAELLDYTWVLQPRGTLLRQRVDALFQSAGLTPPQRVIDSPSVMMATAMVARSNALAVVATALAALHCTPGRAAILPRPERLSVEPYGLIRLRDRPLSPGAMTLLRAVQALAWPAAPG